MLVIEKQYSDRELSEKYTIDVFLYLLEKLYGISMKTTPQEGAGEENREGQG